MKNDNHFLKLALKQAKINQGFCFPNPSVGSIIVDVDKNIISVGYHLGLGFPHAEINALQKLGNNIPKNCTMYVTLEPCCHWGRTPPCVDAIIHAGIKRVVYALQDPNPLVSGNGVAILKNAGIICDYIPISSITEFYEAYIHWHTTKLPYVTAKIALSLNGAIAQESGKPAQITGSALKKFTHQSRMIYDAVLTSSETIIQDNPQLNVRLAKKKLAKPIYIVDSHLRLPLHAEIFKTAKSITIFHAKNANTIAKAKLINQGVKCAEIKHTAEGLCLKEVLRYIGKEGVHSLWVEAGGKLFTNLFENKLLQQAYIYISLRWLHHGKIAFPKGISLDDIAKQVLWRQFGNDVLCDIRF